MRSYDVKVIRQLRAAWGAPAASPPPPRLVWRDIALVVLLPLAIVFEALVRWQLPWIALSFTVAIALVPLLLWRRTRPLLALLIAFAAMGLVALLAGEESLLYSTVFLILFPYALFRWGSGRAALIGLAVILANLMLNELVPPIVLEDVIGGAVVLVAIVTLALAMRFRASERLREVEQARLLERERLARDLHDTVAHHVSAITVTAQAGLATGKANPEAALKALEVIEKEASLTLNDMRSMVHVLRLDDPAGLAPSPRLSGIEELLRRERGGPEVDVQLRGDLDNLSPAVAAAVYRLVQESVTNARRHARHATRISVVIVRDTLGVRVEVSDDGDAVGSATPGFGITGMMERAKLLGGTCTAGSNGGRGWTVTAILPRSGWAT